MSEAIPVRNRPPVSLRPATAKDSSQDRQKQMIADHYEKLAHAKENGKKVVYTYVPGNLT